MGVAFEDPKLLSFRGILINRQRKIEVSVRAPFSVKVVSVFGFVSSSISQALLPT